MSVARLVDRVPVIAADELIARLVPPPRFASYLPDPAEASQAVALNACDEFAEQVNIGQRKPLLRKVFGGAAPAGRGLYLDGGFGVGKTHLLARPGTRSPDPRRTAPLWS